MTIYQHLQYVQYMKMLTIYQMTVKSQHQQDARIDDVQLHNMIGDGWECVFIRDIMGIKQYVYDAKHHIEFV